MALKDILQRMDYFSVKVLADEIEGLGADAISELRKLAEEKRRRAVLDGRAYISPTEAQQIDAFEAIANGLNWNPRRKKRAPSTAHHHFHVVCRPQDGASRFVTAASFATRREAQARVDELNASATGERYEVFEDIR